MTDHHSQFMSCVYEFKIDLCCLSAATDCMQCTSVCLVLWRSFGSDATDRGQLVAMAKKRAEREIPGPAIRKHLHVGDTVRHSHMKEFCLRAEKRSQEDTVRYSSCADVV